MSYTLIVPTYNRPGDLGRLLRFLDRQGARFPVLVLDSSRPEAREQNAAACSASGLDVRLERFDPEMTPWEKFSRGADLVQTEFSSLCADDDLVLVPGVEAVLDFLGKHGDYSVCHGWYFSFYQSGGALGLTTVTYKGPGLEADDPVDRLWQLFSGYEAVSYAIHRTGVLQKSLRLVQNVQSMLWRELLGGALAAVSGKIARLPVLYAGRSLGPSAAYVNWHPVDFLVSGPRALLEDYLRYRATLLSHYRDCGHGGDEAAIANYVDLIHLRYLSEYFKPRVIDHMFSGIRAGRSREEIMGGVWPVLLERQGVEGALHRSRLLRRLRDRLAPWVRGYHVRRLLKRHAYSTLPSRTTGGVARDYHLYDELRAQLASAQLDPAALMEALRGYE